MVLRRRSQKKSGRLLDTGICESISRLYVAIGTDQGFVNSYKKRHISRTSDTIKSFTFHCAQIRGEETKQKLTGDLNKRRAQMTMDRFTCNGWLHVTMKDGDQQTAGMCVMHHRSHCPYVDISIDEKVATIVEEMKNLPASKVHVWCIIKSSSILILTWIDLGPRFAGKPCDRVNRETNILTLGTPK